MWRIFFIKFNSKKVEKNETGITLNIFLLEDVKLSRLPSKELCITERILTGVNNVILIDPLAYQDFIWLMNRSKIIITDSGGVQEEAPSLGKPVLVMRDTTERPEAVEAGTVLLVGTNEDLIVSKALDLINNQNNFIKMSKLHNPYGDGLASKRIVEFIKNIK